MKKILLFGAMLFGLVLTAQNTEPKFEKEGEKVKATYFHDNGEVAQQGYFYNDKLDGKWTMFNDKGEKIAMGNYVNGVKTGTWLFWDNETVKEVDFDNNKIAAIATKEAKSLVAH